MVASVWAQYTKGLSVPSSSMLGTVLSYSHRITQRLPVMNLSANTQEDSGHPPVLVVGPVAVVDTHPLFDSQSSDKSYRRSGVCLPIIVPKDNLLLSQNAPK